MTQLLAALDGAWRVLIVALILGAGLPALFSVGIRQLAVAGAPDATHRHTWQPTLHRALAYAVFGVILLAVLLGLAYIVAHGLGVQIRFDGLIPVLVKR